MLITSRQNVPLLYFEQLQSCAGLVHAVSTRKNSSNSDSELDLAGTSGDARDQLSQNLAAVAAVLGVDPGLMSCARQMHGSRVQCIEDFSVAASAAYCRDCGECDALVTDRPGVTLLIRVADCVPMLLYDPVRRVVAVVHAGWKGTLAGIAGLTITRMRERYGCRPSDLLAGIGPAIGPCCFNVGEDVADKFRAAPGLTDCVRSGRDGVRVDLPQANRVELLHSGLLPQNVEMSGYCTACRLDIFFSYRGEQGKTGRFGLFAGLFA